MSDNERVVQELQQLANRRDAAAIHASLAESMHAIDPSMGVSAATRMHAVQSALLAAFSDLQYQVVRTLSSGDAIVVECAVSGTHTGAFAGVPPTNRRIDVPATFWLEVVGGKLTACRSYFDGISLMEQIGGIPLPSTPRSTTPVP